MPAQVTFEPPSYTEEKFALYSRYQQEIHHEAWERQPSGFKRFLVHSPLAREAIEYPSGRPDHLPAEYGTYHQLYRLDGKLVAFGVIDVLPRCVLSVYFMWEKEWEKFSLGKLSVLREAALVREMHEAGVMGMKYLYMGEYFAHPLFRERTKSILAILVTGFYVHSCRKMLYKGDYAPSYLVDPEDYSWAPLETCRPLLDKYHYACFSHPERSLDTPATSPDPTPEIPLEVLQNVRHVIQTATERGEVVAPVADWVVWQPQHARGTVLSMIDALGEKVAQEVLFDLSSL
ncbi:Arginyl-tRNA--protein transferase 1 [Trametes pubescens]|uniref:Arginyl-tRNA--protein transferase 1 n=1 Tax=Trametes pubescens TaxID=154538 RepID=A0A1M2VRV4_TRAPU|nr:Arginyl-tRNA--protein transferase 1 [Trametes pubescens]